MESIGYIDKDLSCTPLNMLFDFQAFIDELREKPEKKQIVEKYESVIGAIDGDIKDQERYEEYVSKFSVIPFNLPEELKEDFDRELLQQLVVSSFSSDYELKKEEGKEEKELYIAVKSWDQSVVKTVSELRSFQILRLYEIYIEEQMNLHALKKEDESEQAAIDNEREAKITRRNAILNTLDKDEIAQKTKAEQESKLGNLMDQL